MKTSDETAVFGLNSRGFTMIELISILVIVGMLAAVAVSRISSTAAYSLTSEADILRMHLRYAQLRALSDSVTWGVTFSSNSYTLQKNGVQASSNLPNEGSATHTLPGGITLSGSTITFDTWGTPVIAWDNTNPVTGSITIIISSGSSSQSITITKNTGFIP